MGKFVEHNRKAHKLRVHSGGQVMSPVAVLRRFPQNADLQVCRTERHPPALHLSKLFNSVLLQGLLTVR